MTGILKAKGTNIIREVFHLGELAQLAERVLSMHEVAGSIPAFSILYFVMFHELVQLLLYNDDDDPS